MRVPDLNWPADLFTDAVMPVPETIAALSARPTLWAERANAWIGNGSLDDFPWPVPMSRVEHVAV